LNPPDQLFHGRLAMRGSQQGGVSDQVIELV